jgi:hypothetical protein
MTQNNTVDTAEPGAPARAAGRAGVVAVAAIFGVFYAWDLWEAVSTAVELPVFYEVYGFDVAQLPWWVLVIMIALPPVVFVFAVWLGRRRRLWQRAVLLVVGLAVVAALTLGLVALEAVLRPALLSGVL